jgi:LmbE family N-acetylglucosaminyl deacetylase
MEFDIRKIITEPRPVSIDALHMPIDLRLAVLAPHPDDFDAIGITLRFFHQRGNPLSLAVLTSGVSGVEDSYCPENTPAAKASIRESEQLDSCHFFGLPKQQVEFLRLSEDDNGHLADNLENLKTISAYLKRKQASIIFLPHGNDSNAGHRISYSLARQACSQACQPMAALLNHDPKTIKMRHDVIAPFDDEAAAWKGELLRFHKSQHQRNLHVRGHGFDERILRVNRTIAEEHLLATKFAEAFEFKILE